MNKMKVSYLVALYNKEEFIEECIESILAEDSEDLEIEVCIVDDGSTDYSLEIIRNKYTNNEKVKIENFKTNKGKNAAYNKAFTMSTGHYICLFGADDIVIKNRTAALLKLSTNYDKSVYGVCVKYFQNHESINEVKHKLDSVRHNNLIKTVSFKDIVMQNTLGGGCSFLKREHAEAIFPIPEELAFEDWWISYHLVKNEWIIVSNQPVSIYRIHTNNDNGTEGPDYLASKIDYARHYAYLNEFLKIAESEMETSLILKSLILRDSFFGKGHLNLRVLKTLSLDKYSFKILLFYILGSERYYNIRSLFYDLIEKKYKNKSKT